MEVINEDPYTPQTLIESVFAGAGIDIISVDYQGDDRSAAYFRGGQDAIGIDRGIVMTTGITVGNGTEVDLESTGGAYLSANSNSPLSNDPDLRTIMGNNNTALHDITAYTITFRPLGDSVSFKYVFASEEYPEYVCSNFNDLFGFFISGPGINGPFSNNAINLARIPDTDLPVRINTLNGGTVGASGSASGCAPPDGSLDYSEFYVDNDGSSVQPVFDGFTQVFTAATKVEACEVYTIKLIIADVGDAVRDSGVYLEGRSFAGQATDLEIVNLAIDGGVAEGCRPAELHFYTSQPVDQDLPLLVNFFGDATPGLDYTQPPANLTIPAGDSLLVVSLAAFEDNIADAGEYIHIELQRSNCFTDTFTIRIEDNRLESLSIDNIPEVCGGQTVNLNSNVVSGQPTVSTFENPNDVDLAFAAWRSSFIEVSGVVPEIMNAVALESVCITQLTHNRPADIDAFLFSPAGVVVELTTDNGGNGNGAPFEGYLNTCFTPSATNPITGPGNQAPVSMVPFTGDWQPEGNLDDLWLSGEEPTNGTWELRIRDDAPFVGGELNGWSISFRQLYEIEYQWDQTADLSCYDCPDPQLTTETEGFVGLTVSDIYGCTLTDSVEVVFEPTPSLSFGPTCMETTENSISFNWGSAPSALSYEIRDEAGNWVSVGLDTSFLADNLVMDSTYTFFIRPVFSDCFGPSQAVSCQTFSCTQNSPQLLGVTTDALCADSLSGSIDLSTTGGESPMRFELNGQVQSNGLFTGLGIGNYQAIVVDGRGCRDTTALSVAGPSPLTVSTTVQGQVGCTTTASIEALVNGGSGNYSYRWNGENGDAVLSNINSGGEYVLEITDQNGCQLYDTTLLSGPAALSSSFTVIAAACSNVADGSIVMTPAGGEGPYSYDWADLNQNISNRENLAVGSYIVSITDALGCMIVDTIRVDQGVDVEIIGTSEVARCFDEASGAISLVVNNGSGSLTYNWDDPLLTGANPTGLIAGTYAVTVSDDRGCMSDTILEIIQPQPLLLTNTEQGIPNCAGDENGFLNVVVEGGNQGYQYNWSNGNNQANNNQLAAGEYQLTVTDQRGCVLEESFSLPEPPALEVNTETIDNLCAGDSNGTATVSSLATSSVTYYWPNLNASGATQNNLSAGTYEVEATDVNGCLTVLEVTVEEPPAIVAEPLLENISCAGENNGWLELPVSGGTPGYSFRVNEEDWQSSNVYFGLAAGRYQASIQDANGCILELNDLLIRQPEPLEISLGERQTIRYGDSLQLFVQIEGGIQPVLEYSWTPNDSTLFSCQDCPMPWIKPEDQTTIHLQLLDQAGCLARSQVTILVEKDFPVHVPTGFTPNQDGQNDLLVVHGLPDITIAHFQIFDRWGELVYEKRDFPTNDMTIGWDGTLKSEPLNANVFIWQLEAIYPDGKRERFHGQSALIR